MGGKRRRLDDFHHDGCSSTSAFNNHHNNLLRQGLSFFHKVKQVYPHNHEQFLKVFWDYCSGFIDNLEFQFSIFSLIRDYPSLMNDFAVLMKNSGLAITGFQGKLKVGIENRGINPKLGGSKAESELFYQLNRGKAKSLGSNGEGSARISISDCEPEREEQPRRRKKQGLRSEEERRSRWEDAMYESGMCIKWFESALSFATKVKSGTEETEIQGMSRTHFFRCLEQLYGDYTDEVMNVWNKNPNFAATFIVNRLTQKLKYLNDFDKQLQF